MLVRETFKDVRQLFLTLFPMLLIIGCTNEYKTPVDGCAAVTSTKVWGGETCNANSASPVVNVVAFAAVGDEIKPVHFCSGTLISQTSVLTAGHCVLGPMMEAQARGISIAGFGVYVGGLSGEGIWVSVASTHPKYRYQPSVGTTTSFVRYRHDLAVLTLRNAPSTFVAPMPLLGSMAIEKGDRLEAFGYGLTEKQETGELRAITFDVFDYQSSVFVVKGDGKVSLCNGDSGGPTLIRAPSGRPAVAGVASFGEREGCTTEPAKFYGFVDIQEQTNFDFITSRAPDARVE